MIIRKVYLKICVLIGSVIKIKLVNEWNIKVKDDIIGWRKNRYDNINDKYM